MKDRAAFFEHLEPREMLASDWQNPFVPRDVNRDGIVVPNDVLVAINELNGRVLIGPDGSLPDRGAHPNAPYYDVNGDGSLTPQDVLVVINALNGDRQVPTVSASLKNDTAPNGSVNSDGLTFDATISGQVLDDLTGVRTLTVEVDSGAAQTVPVQLDGGFEFDPGFARDGSQDGLHTLRFTATDGNGNVSPPHVVTLTLDTLPPALLTFDLAPESDTGEPGDGITESAQVRIVGVTEAGISVIRVGTDETVVASETGAFQFLDVPLEPGENAVQLRAVDAAGNARDTERVFTREFATEIDPVLRWNEALLNAIVLDATPPPIAARGMAMVNVAMLDVVNAINGAAAYLLSFAQPTNVELNAAISSAAFTVMDYLFPGQAERLELVHEEILAEIPDGIRETQGIQFGAMVGSTLVALRDRDGWDQFIDYVPEGGAGIWTETPPMYDVALLPQWGELQTFAVDDVSSVLPDGPPALTSQEWADAFNEVKQLGRATGSTRTSDQTQIARFWADGPGTFSPPGHWNQIAMQFARSNELSTAENARVMAMVSVALADAGIVSWRSKYDHHFWRPITAIQNADIDFNDNTEADPGWEPLLITPPFPEYTSGHSTFSGAAAAVLTSVFGEEPFSTTSAGLPGVVRSFDNFNAAAKEASRSRVYGGIHYEFSGVDGLAAGHAIAEQTIQRFAVTEDVRAPEIIIESPNDGLFTSSVPTVQGWAIDSFSGVAAVEVRIDNGSFEPVTFDSSGRFSFQPQLALDGSDDGTHVLQFRATDHAGFESKVVNVSFTLDTQAPTLTLTSPLDGETIEIGRLLEGIVDGTGSPIVSLRYQIDGGTARPIAFDPISGGFADVLNVSKLDAGAHSLTVMAQDAAGKTISLSQTFSLDAASPLTITSHEPLGGARDVGSTVRPQVYFSRPIDPDTLNSTNFFAVDSTGAKIPTTIVPGPDGNFAWLFPTAPFPGSSIISIHIIGDTILSESGVMLDADGDGVPGGEFVYRYSTVSLAPLAGTSLSGIVLDPGDDLKPMTFDDIRSGPDGILRTDDDVYMNPIQGARVFILGLEDQVVFTDEFGRFSLPAVPAGTIKLVIDGRTATNSPEGTFWPEMVMDLEMEIGAANTVMGTMGTRQERAANANRPEVYMPRLELGIFVPIDDEQPTTVHVNPVSAPNLSPAQRQHFQLEVPPQSLVDEHGQPVENPRVGVSTVPPQLVREMLPPGLMQHSFDITIQAPDAAVFNRPVQMTLPNVFSAPAGSKVNFLSFDHTTGRLVIEGTATVSADGQSITTDPGTGITKPGWHSFTPPGSNVGGGQVGAEPGDSGATTEESERLPLVSECVGNPDQGPNNSPPTISLQPDRMEAEEGETVRIKIIQSDPDNNEVCVTARSPGAYQAEYNEEESELVLLVTEDMAPGPIEIEVGASDGQHFVTTKVVIQGIEVNSPPVLSPKPQGVLGPVQLLRNGSNDLVQMTFTVRDPDRPSSLPGAPTEIAEDDVTEFRVFTEGPGSAQAILTGWSGASDRDAVFEFEPDEEGICRFTIVVNDGGAPALADIAQFELLVEEQCSLFALVESLSKLAQSAADAMASMVPMLGAAQKVVTVVSQLTTLTAQLIQIEEAPDPSVSCVLIKSIDATVQSIAKIMEEIGDIANIPDKLGKAIRVAEDVVSAVESALKAADCLFGFDLDAPAWLGELQDLMKTGATVVESMSKAANPGYLFGQAVKSVSALLNRYCTAADNEAQSSVTLTPEVTDRLTNLLRFAQQYLDAAKEIPTDQINAAMELKPRAATALNELAAAATMRRIQEQSLGVNEPLHYMIRSLDGGTVLRGMTDSMGAISDVFLSPNQTYEVGYLDPRSLAIGRSIFQTGNSASRVGLGGTILGRCVDADPDNDGLCSYAEDILGTNRRNSDSDGDGVDDRTEVQRGDDPLGGRALPSGVFASLPLAGEANEVALEVSSDTGVIQTAYVATGSFGFAIVDASNVKRPTIQSQLDLSGNAVDVVVDHRAKIAVVASTTSLHFIGVSSPIEPVILETKTIEATHVEIYEDVVLVASDTNVFIYDLSDRELIKSEPVATERITAMARLGDTLFLLDEDGSFQSFAITPSGLHRRGALNLPLSGRQMAVGGGVAYIPVESGFDGGFMTVDVTDIDRPKLLSAADDIAVPGRAIAVDGAGRAVTVGQAVGLGNRVQVSDVTNPTDTGKFVTQFPLPAAPRSVAIGAGIAFVANGTAGLQLVNYAPVDNLGIAPEVIVDLDELDVLPDPGVQMVEGSYLHIRPEVTDDVQIRDVALVVDGAVVSHDVTFPFEVSYELPALSAGQTSVTVQLVATDTAGNRTSSTPAVIDLVPDTVPPQIVAISPPDRVTVFGESIVMTVSFSEAMLESTLDDAHFALVPRDGGAPINPSAVTVRDRAHTVDLIFEDISAGEYDLFADGDEVLDRAGNPLGGDDLRSSIRLAEIRDPGSTFATALDLGLLLIETSYADSLDENTDTVDVYKFTLEEAQAVEIKITDQTEALRFRLVRDLNNNGSFDNGEDFAVRFGGSGASEEQDLLPGEYFIIVNDSRTTPYTITVSPRAEIPVLETDPSDEFATATDLGTLEDTLVVSDMIMEGVDPTDVYSFSLLTTRVVNVRATGHNDALRLRLIRDLNENGTLDNGEQFATNFGGEGTNTSQDLLPGTYFVVIADSFSTPYTLTITAGAEIPLLNSDPGDTFASATDLGPITDSLVVSDFIMEGVDSRDFYSFTLDSPRVVTIRATGHNDALRLRLIRDLNENGQLDNGEQYAINFGGEGVSASQDLLPGTYFVTVADSFSTPYTLTITAGEEIPLLDSDPGETFATARDLGALEDSLAATDLIMDGVDPTDIYSFTLDIARSVTIRATGHNDALRLRLIRDLNENGQFDNGEQYAINFGGQGVSASQDLLPGTYFVTVADSFSTPYTLTITAGDVIPLLDSDPGETFATARDLGALEDSLVASDLIMDGIDPADIYSFTLDVARVVTVRATGHNDALRLRLIRDLNENGQLDNGEQFATNFGGDGVSASQELLPGTYFVSVADSFSTPYTLTITTGAEIPLVNPDPGSTLSSAANLGVLTETLIASDLIMQGVDSTDIFSFTIEASRNVMVRVTGQDDALRIRLIRDANQNGEFDGGEELDSAFGGNGVSLTEELLSGTYFVLIAEGFSTLYTLTITAED